MSELKRARGRPHMTVSPSNVLEIWRLHLLGVNKTKISHKLDISTYLITKILSGPTPQEFSPNTEQIADHINSRSSLPLLTKKIDKLDLNDEIDSEQSLSETEDDTEESESE